MRTLAILVITATVGATAALASSTVWRVLARGVDSGTYYSFASARVDVDQPKALRVRATGKSLELGGYFSCELPDRKVASGQAIVLSVGASESCTVSATATAEDGGRVVVLIEGQK
jgi:hypothetical protein